MDAAEQMPWGLPTIRFPGQYYDEETGLHYNRHRYYDPSIGRYVSADPIGQAGSVNLFEYAGNSPIVAADPFGLLVFGTYDLGSGLLVITDQDTGETQVISAESGGKPIGAPVPEGTYDILDHPDRDFFRLEHLDQSFGDDTHDPTGRDLLRLHRPGLTRGCIAALQREPWEMVRDMIRNTQTGSASVRSKSRNPFAPEMEIITRFGRLRVIDTRRIPLPPNASTIPDAPGP